MTKTIKVIPCMEIEREFNPKMLEVRFVSEHYLHPETNLGYCPESKFYGNYYENGKGYDVYQCWKHTDKEIANPWYVACER